VRATLRTRWKAAAFLLCGAIAECGTPGARAAAPTQIPSLATSPELFEYLRLPDGTYAPGEMIVAQK